MISVRTFVISVWGPAVGGAHDLCARCETV